VLLDDVVHPVSGAVEQLRSLPWAAHMMAAGALATGLVLWLIGRRVLKPMVAVLFALLGGAIGFVVVPMTILAGSVSVYVGLAVGAAIGALLGVILYRFAMAIGLGLVLGVAAPLTVAAVMSFKADHHADGAPAAQAPSGVVQGEPNGDAEADTLPARVTEEVIRRQIDSLSKQLETDTTEPITEGEAAAPKPADTTALEEVVRTAADRVEAFARAVADDVATGWGQLSPRHRLILTGSAGMGLALGIILGVVLPAWAAGMVTALLGAGVWLAAGTWLALAIGAPGSEHLQRPAREWLVIWLGVSLLGVCVQWLGLVGGKKRKKGRDGESE
jgi:hypothetical protein